MKVAFDNSVLSLALAPNQNPPVDPKTGAPLAKAKERVDAFIDCFKPRQDILLIPTPALTEALCIAPDMERALDRFNRSGAVEMPSFDQRAAVELATEERRAIADGTYKPNGVPKQKAKFDRQIVMVAKVNGAEALYTDDTNQTAFARRIGLKVVHSWELPEPPPEQEVLELPDGARLEKKRSI